MINLQNTQYCIVGTGFSGTAALVHLVDGLVEAEAKSPLSKLAIYTVESRSTNGPGYPYSPDELLPSHLCNNQAKVMSLKDKSNDFFDWLVQNKNRLAQQHPHLILETHPKTSLPNWSPDEHAFYPRALFGVYLSERFSEAVKKASNHGIAITTLNGYQAIDGYRNNGKFTLKIRSPKSNEIQEIKALDKVLLSTGHWTPKQKADEKINQCYLSSPYPTHKLRASLDAWLEGGEPIKVLVRGMGPSGIDAIMSLVESGKFHYSQNGHVTGYTPSKDLLNLQIVVGSRSGYFPAVRGKPSDYTFRYLSENSFSALENKLGKKLKLDDILNLIDLELRAATANKVGWDDIKKPSFISKPKFDSCKAKLEYDQSCPALNDIVHAIILKARRMKFYRHLDSDEKALYDRTLDTYFIRTAVPIPQLNAEKLIALFNAGILTSIAMGYKAYGERQSLVVDENGFKVGYLENDQKKSMMVDAVIEASGQNFLLQNHPSDLVQALLKRGEIVAHHEKDYVTGGIMLDSDETYRVMCATKTGSVEPSPFLVSYGVLTRFWQNERNFSAAFIEAAKWLAKDWSQYFITQQNTRDELITQRQSRVIEHRLEAIA